VNVEGAGNEVEYGRCTECGYLMFPIPPLSPCGHDAPVDKNPLIENGLVYSWTRTRLGESDRLLVMVDFLEGRLRVSAPLLGADHVEIGDAVRIESAVDTPYAFVPVN
jgi:uncharacterized OB-fold protein